MSPATTTYTEDELVLLLKQKSREAFNYLYKNYSAVLYTAVRKVIANEDTANDVLQESFVKIWNNIGQYDPAKGRIYTWMMNISRNAAIDKLRSKGEIMKSKIHMGDDVVNNVQKGMTSEQPIDTIGIRKNVGLLKPEHRVIVDLAYFKGYTLDEISKELNVPLGTVKTRMRSAMQQLRDIYNVNTDSK